MFSKDITAIILTKDEEVHIERCIQSLQKVCSRIYVVDSFSTDKTCDIALKLGAIVLQNTYLNQAQQFQWAIDNCLVETNWVIRLDADEFLTDKLVIEIQTKLDVLDSEITGVLLPLRVKFWGRVLRFGNLRPISVLRLWRTGAAFMEQRWMDEHLIIKHGRTIRFKGYFIDDQQKGLTSWINKHNNYSNREILTQLASLYNFSVGFSDTSCKQRNSKKSLYYRLPIFLRAFMYFTIRYIIFLGFLDGIPGFVWLTLQAYWYRFLVDAKIYEMRKHLGDSPAPMDIVDYVEEYFNISLETPKSKNTHSY